MFDLIGQVEVWTFSDFLSCCMTQFDPGLSGLVVGQMTPLTRILGHAEEFTVDLVAAKQANIITRPPLC